MRAHAFTKTYVQLTTAYSRWYFCLIWGWKWQKRSFSSTGKPSRQIHVANSSPGLNFWKIQRRIRAPSPFLFSSNFDGFSSTNREHWIEEVRRSFQKFSNQRFPESSSRMYDSCAGTGTTVVMRMRAHRPWRDRYDSNWHALICGLHKQISR